MFVSTLAAADITLKSESSYQEAALFHVRLIQDVEGSWLVRGRVTRVDKDVKVPAGQIRVTVYDEQGKSLYSRSGKYKPAFVHRKTKRASYFTVPIPDRYLDKAHRLTVRYSN